MDLRRRAEELVGPEWAEWYFMTPEQRWHESSKIWEAYLLLGGTLDPEPDPQSPFYDPEEWTENRTPGRLNLQVLPRGSCREGSR